MRCFGGNVHDLWSAKNPEEAQLLEQKIATVDSIGNTDISRALNCAIEDCLRENYDTADIMIVTDGEDDKLCAATMKEALQRSKIRLHAILMGTTNHSLRACSDVYQEIPESGVLLHPVQQSLRQVFQTQRHQKNLQH